MSAIRKLAVEATDNSALSPVGSEVGELQAGGAGAEGNIARCPQSNHSRLDGKRE